MSDDLEIWQCKGPHGELITVTSLEAQAVKAWAEGLLAGGIKHEPGEEEGVKFLTGFLVGAATASDEDVALAIAMGRIEECKHGDAPLMATPMSPEDAVVAAAKASPVKRRRFRSW